MFMNSLRVTRGIEIEVNDEGEKITLNVENQNFIDDFYGLMERLDETAKEMASSGVTSLPKREQVRALIERTKPIMSDIDRLFGEGCCRKVFGDIIPSPYLIADFLEQLTPIAEQYMDERQKAIAKKYNRDRKGAKGNKYRTRQEIVQDAVR